MPINSLRKVNRRLVAILNGFFCHCKQIVSALSPGENSSNRLANEVNVKAQALMFLVNQVKPSLGRYTIGGINGVCFLCGHTPRQKYRFVPVVNDSRQTRYTRSVL